MVGLTLTQLRGCAMTNKRDLQAMCQALLQADPDIVAIVQFGSSVYAPDLAHDVDLVVTTRAKKDSAVYWDALLDYDVDLVVREPGQPVGRDIALSIRAWSRSLYGDDQTREEVMAYMTIPTYEEARKMLTLADENLVLAQQSDDEFFRDRRYRDAFDTLFHAARYAAMTFLHTEETRWGRVRRQLPPPFDTRFRDFIETLHVEYGYHGEYPKDMADEVYAHWRQVVSQFMDDVERSSTVDKSG